MVAFIHLFFQNACYWFDKLHWIILLSFLLFNGEDTILVFTSNFWNSIIITHRNHLFDILTIDMIETEIINQYIEIENTTKTNYLPTEYTYTVVCRNKLKNKNKYKILFCFHPFVSNIFWVSNLVLFSNRLINSFSFYFLVLVYQRLKSASHWKGEIQKRLVYYIFTRSKLKIRKWRHEECRHRNHTSNWLRKKERTGTNKQYLNPHRHHLHRSMKLNQNTISAKKEKNYHWTQSVTEIELLF